MGWTIAKNKLKGFSVESKITQDEWESVIDSDSTMTWFDITPLGVDLIRINQQAPLKRLAYYKIDKRKGYSMCSFNWVSEGFILVDDRPTTLNKIHKIFELAEKLDANVYKAGVLKKRGYLEKLEAKKKK